MPSIRGFIDQRRADLTAERETIAPRLQEIDDELAELLAAEAGLDGRVVADRRAWPVPRVPSAGPSPGTIMHQVVSVLRQHAEPITAQEIRAEIKATYERDVARPTLSPQLSRLARDGWIRRQGRFYTLAPPEDRPSDPKNKTPHP